MNPTRLTVLIFLGEGLMLVIAIASAIAAGIPLEAGPLVPGVIVGIITALALGTLNLYLLRKQRRHWPGDALHHVCRVVVHPLFEHVRMRHILLVSAVAGLGEELLFRGVLQPLVGVAAASVLFGAVHIGGRSFVGYGLWAMCIGALFGWLTVATSGLAAAVVAHALYDAVALTYVRFKSDETCA